jgi:hypothetical protein
MVQEQAVQGSHPSTASPYGAQAFGFKALRLKEIPGGGALASATSAPTIFVCFAHFPARPGPQLTKKLQALREHHCEDAAIC